MTEKWYSALVKENLYGIGSQTVMILAGVVFALVFPRLLGPELFGYFSLVFAFVNISLFFCKFGSYEALVKLIPASIVRGSAARCYRFLSRVRYGLTIATSILLFALSDFIAAYLFKKPELGFAIRISTIFMFSYSLYDFYDALFATVKRNKFAFYINLVFHSCRIALPLILYYIYGTYTSVLLGIGLAALMGFIAGLTLKQGLESLKKGTAEVDYKTFGKYFFYGSLGYLGGLLLQWMDSLIVGVLINPTELSFYRVGIMVTGVVWLFIPFSSRVLFALYSEKTEGDEKEKINTVYSYSLRYALVIAFLIMAGIWLTSDFFITLVYGKDYAPAAPILLVLSFLAVESALNATNTPLLYGIGKIDIQTKYYILVGLISSAACLYASKYGVIGIAFALMTVRIISMIGLTFYVLRLLNINLKPTIYGRPIFCAVFTFIVMAFFKPYVSSLPSGIAYGLGIVIFYGILAVASKAVSMQEIKKIASAVMDR